MRGRSPPPPPWGPKKRSMKSSPKKSWNWSFRCRFRMIFLVLMFTTPLVCSRATSRNVSRVSGPWGRGTAAVTAAAMRGSAGRAMAVPGWIWVVTTAPSSMAAMATVKNEAMVRVRMFIGSKPPGLAAQVRRSRVQGPYRASHVP